MHEYQNPDKVYVRVCAVFEQGGKIVPVWFQSEDSPRVKIDRIADIRRAAATRAGGSGMGYTICVRDKQFYLFHDDFDDSWFVERGSH